MVRVVFASALRPATNGETQLELDFSGDLESILKVLRERYGDGFETRLMEKGTLRRHITVYVDGKNVRFLEGNKTKIAGNSEVLFLPAVSGG